MAARLLMAGLLTFPSPHICTMVLRKKICRLMQYSRLMCLVKRYSFLQMFARLLTASLLTFPSSRIFKKLGRLMAKLPTYVSIETI